MIPTSRKSTLNKKASTPTLGLINPQDSKINKSDLLKRFLETNEGEEDDIFGTIEGGINFDDDFKTLRIGEIETLKMDQREDNPNEFDDQFVAEFENFERSLMRNKQRMNLALSPMDSISTSSPKLSLLTPGNRLGKENGNSNRITRKTLSEYSEEDETDVTSQLNEDDFDDIDNIFGAEESGIYGKINQKLLDKQLKLKHDAEVEDLELERKYANRTKSHKPTQENTLKLKDFNKYNKNALSNHNLSLLDQIENDKTINYEYTRDDFEEFEAGFDRNFERKLENKRVGINGNRLVKNKSSMPNLGRNQASKIKKFKSVMDINSIREGFEQVEEGSEEDEEEDPGFNYNNNVIRKLDRIPSFYNRKAPEKDSSNKKQILLNRYKEQTKQPKHNAKHGDNIKHKIGLVKYLNNNSIIPNPVIPTSNSSMKYNGVSKRWEGNEADLMRFETMHKPSLITLNDLKKEKQPVSLKLVQETAKDERNPNMVYDNEKLRWINLNEESESVFDEIPDLEDGLQNGRAYILSSPPTFQPPGVMGSFNSSPNNVETNGLQSPITRRGLSQFTQRTISTNTISSDDEVNDVFNLSGKLIERFSKEEEKVNRKISHWFTVNETYNYNNNEIPSHEFYWEIRKMVTDNDS